MSSKGLEIDISIKLIFLGDFGVGKTNLMTRYSSDEFHVDTESKSVVDFCLKQIVFEEKNVMIELWDTAGQERYKSLSKGYFEDTDGVVLAFDLSDQKSFESLDTWLEILKAHVSLSSVEIVLIGNKMDLEDNREISYSEAINYSSSKGLVYREVSCYDNSDKLVQEAIDQMVYGELTRHTDQEDQNESGCPGVCQP